MIALALVLTVAAASRFGPERMLLGGIAVGAACSAIISAVVSLGNMQSYALLRWLTGSNGDVQASHLLLAMSACAVLLPLSLLPFVGSPFCLSDLRLGEPRHSPRPARLAVMVLASVLTAAASIFVGPLSFVGLIAPQVARLLGLGRASHHTSVLSPLVRFSSSRPTGSRVSLRSPTNCPSAFFASLLGGPCLVYLLSRGVRPHG